MRRLLLLASLLATACDQQDPAVKRYPTVFSGVQVYAEAWCEWDHACIDKDVFDMDSCLLQMKAALCQSHACPDNTVDWTDTAIDACVADIYGNMETCSVFGDSYTPPSCSFLLGFVK